MRRLYQDLIKQNILNPPDLLPPVIPIVLYNGESKWSAPQEMSELIIRGPGSLSSYSPKVRYLLIEERNVNVVLTDDLENLLSGIIKIEQSKSVHEALRALYIMLHWLRSPGAQQDSLRRAITVWFNQVQKPAKLLDENAPPPADKQEMESMIIDKMQRWQEELRNEGRNKWLKEGREEGHEEGKALGAVTLFEKLLTLKFGSIDEATLAKIKSANLEELQLWAENILTATTLSDVFKK